MIIVLLMAGETILRRGLEICEGAHGWMTAGAGGISVLPCQLEREQAMVKV